MYIESFFQSGSFLSPLVLLSFLKIGSPKLYWVAFIIIIHPFLFINHAGIADIFVFNQQTRNDILRLLNLTIHRHMAEHYLYEQYNNEILVWNFHKLHFGRT